MEFIWAVVVVALAVVLLRQSVSIVRQGYEYTIERFGKYQATFAPGLYQHVSVGSQGRRGGTEQKQIDHLFEY